MKKKYVVRARDQKFPVRSYTDRSGQRRPLGRARSFVVTLLPDKAGVFFLNVHILEDLAGRLLSRDDFVEEDFIRVAGKAAEVWLREEISPADPHSNGRDTLVLDMTWYPAGPDGEPLLVNRPQYFDVEVEEPESSQPAWWLEEEKKDE